MSIDQRQPECAECGGPLDPWAVEYGIPFCSEACSQASDARRRTISGTVPTIEGGWKERPWSEPWSNDPDLIASAGEISAIGIQRTMCFGPCPVYRMELHRSGQSVYTGERFVDMVGRHRARMDPDEFALLALAVAYLRFEEHQPHYARAVTCSPDAIVWVRRHGSTFTVSDYAGGGPPSLLTIQILVDEAGRGLPWELAGRPASGLR